MVKILILAVAFGLVCSSPEDDDSDTVARDAVAVETTEIKTTVLVKREPLESLRFLKEPVDLEVDENSSVRLECRVEEVDSARYTHTWYKSRDLRNFNYQDEHRIAGVDGPELMLAPVRSHDAGQYICTVNIVGTNYTITSNTGRLVVRYYDGPRDSGSSEPRTYIQVMENKDYHYLDCNLPESYPKVEAIWYKNGRRISDERRMFIMPRETYFGHEKIFTGALIIMYIEREDAGDYDCKVRYNEEEYLLQSYTLSINGKVETGSVIAPSNTVTMDGQAYYGGEATLYCSGIGKPAPYISWTKMDGSRVESSEKFLLQDNKRRLVINNVNSDDGNSYTCSVNVRNANKKTQIVGMSIIPPKDAQITFLEIPESQVIRANRYHRFTLRCSIDLEQFIGVEGSTMPVLFWLKNGEQLKHSDRRNPVATQDNNILESSIEFIAPNESDLGVYQCIARGTTQQRQATAYVNVRKTEVEYDVDQAEPTYDVITVPMTVSAAEEHCRRWRTNGHLVSIMSHKEAETVTRLLKQEGIVQAWIGLISEKRPGIWEWTQPADDSETFSFWAKDNPDNLYEVEEYAIMDTRLGGRWLDVRLVEKKQAKKFPFVCKLYTTTCPSIREYFDEKLEPLNKVETKETRYGVGESITVTCSDRSVHIKETLTCSTAGTYFPDEAFACPIYSNSRATAPSQTLSLLPIIIVTLSCSVRLLIS